ncbi:unnamed protein product [Rhizophagus irregularis]|nr:unnamed protein product [Rhizophagus irregularis]
MLQPSHSTIPLRVPNQPYRETAAKAGTHRLTKHLKYDDKNKVNMNHTAFIKIIKITENWKMIAYFTEQQMMETVVDTSLKEGSADLIWKLANMAVKKYKKITPLTEELIVGMIINWRLGADSDSDSDSVDEEPGVIKAEASTKTPLKQNNIAPKEVV